MRLIERTLLDLSVLALIALAGVIFANVGMRWLLGTGLPDAIILVRELMIAAVILPMAAATAARGHVAVTFFSDRMPPDLRGWLVVLGHLVGVLALIPLIFAAWRVTSQVWSSGEFYYGDLNLPRWPGVALFLVGLGLMWLRLCLMLAGDIRQLMRGGTILDDNGNEVS
ncbi:TRAP transporter small permease subunit [Paracoccus sp. 1_MG-2023]|uniref:TRAP transporter small permease n=1 Tax=unclassified Paracoccus (in: a-proteobacteria) TaxID=2688777 RepID=UPI001C088D52|nr:MULTISPECIES: TRAP transporter small permease subunit [unclassified Paracoccus (in: a-proteobacteria)]MBU2956900.1 TRAP transporter small permease subunit [Paracoccus sp. C2R09]MDO6668098.1 TRAP transporter small permease subunit [Paracoccus sp. 1_MG-2023]